MKDLMRKEKSADRMTAGHFSFQAFIPLTVWTCQSRGKQRIAVFIKLLPDTEHDNPRFVCVSSA